MAASRNNVLVTLSGQACMDPGRAIPWLQRSQGALDFVNRASSYRCPLGAEPGTAAVLLTGAKLDDLTRDGAQTLKITDQAHDTLMVSNLYITSATMQSRGRTADRDTLYFVELADRRLVLAQSAVNKSYNVRRPAPASTSGATLCYSESLNAGALWTWQTMLDNLWGLLPSSLRGTAPTLPYSPDGIPDGWRFLGISAWAAIHQILAKIGCTTAFNPVAGTFSYIRLGSTQANLTKEMAKLEKGRLYYNGDSTVGRAATIPATVRVHFKRVNTYGGTEPDTLNTGSWEMNASVSVDVSTGVSGAIAGTIHPIWDDLPALYNAAGSNTNAAALSTRAAEIAANHVNSLLTATSSWRRSIIGCTTKILPGPEIGCVTWRNYGDGLLTDLHRTGRGMVAGAGGGPGAETLLPPDLGRFSHPVSPRECQPVQVYKSGSDPSDTLWADETDHVIPGRVVQWSSSGATALDDCWLYFFDQEGYTLAEDSIGVRHGDHFLGRLAGNFTSDGVTKPLYVVRRHQELIRFVTTGDLVKGGSVTGNRVEWVNGSTSYEPVGNTLTFYDTRSEFVAFEEVPALGTAVMSADRGVLEILTLQQPARVIRGTTTEAFGDTTAGAAEITWDAAYGNPFSGLEPPESTILVYDVYGLHAASPSGTKLFAVYNETENQYEVISGGGGLCMLAKAEGTVSEEGSGTFSVYAGTPGSETDTTVDLTAENKGPEIEDETWVLLFPTKDGLYAMPWGGGGGDSGCCGCMTDNYVVSGLEDDPDGNGTYVFDSDEGVWKLVVNATLIFTIFRQAAFFTPLQADLGGVIHASISGYQYFLNKFDDNGGGFVQEEVAATLAFPECPGLCPDEATWDATAIPGGEEPTVVKA